MKACAAGALLLVGCTGVYLEVPPPPPKSTAATTVNLVDTDFKDPSLLVPGTDCKGAQPPAKGAPP